MTNPFLTVFPRTPLERTFETVGDIDCLQKVGAALAERTGDTRCDDLRKFVREGQTDVYLQRILSNSSCTRGHDIHEIEALAKEGTPALMMNRTCPTAVGYEQVTESRPWYTKSGRLELYRDEPEFIAAGENLPVHREPVDSTFYEPNVIVGPADHEAFRQQGPADHGVAPDDVSGETRRGRYVLETRAEMATSAHPLAKDGYRFLFHTPKYRHGAHTMPIDTDMVAMLFGPFGDVYRHDKRTPFVSEGYVDIHPEDARELGVEDGDSVYLARICTHCTYPACLASCPRGSIHERPEDGIVLVDRGRCRGYQECVRACPYEKVFYNPLTGTSEKCIACYPKVEQGVQPQPFETCIGKIRLAGFLSAHPGAADPANPLDYLAPVKKVALPLFPQFGLEPNVYYIPPVHVPPAFLRQMFGPRAEAALATCRSAVDDADLAGLPGLFGSTERIVPRWKRSGDSVLGLEENGDEIVRVPLREPVHVRAAFDPVRGVPRTNVP